MRATPVRLAACAIAWLLLPGCLSVRAAGLLGGDPALTEAEAAPDEVVKVARELEDKATRFVAFARESSLATETGSQILKRLFQNDGVATHYWDRIEELPVEERFSVLIGDIRRAVEMLADVNLLRERHVALEPSPESKTARKAMNDVEAAFIGGKQARRALDMSMRQLELTEEQAEQFLDLVYQLDLQLQRTDRLMRS